jgi:hypothetical protein
MRGQFFTPATVAEVLLRDARRDLEQLSLPILAPGAVLDPACGDGAFLTAALAAGWASTPARLHGLDIDAEVASGPPGASIQVADGLLSAASLSGRYAAAVGNPPYGGRGVRDLSRPQLQLLGSMFESWRLDREGCARPFVAADLSRLVRFPIASLFVELFVRAVRPGGVACVLLPESLFCNRREASLRAWLLRHARLVSVTSLPADTFARTGTRARTAFVVLAVRHRPLRRASEAQAGASVLLRRYGEGSVQSVTLGSLQEAQRWDPLYHDPRWQQQIGRCTLPLEPLGSFVETLCYGAIKVGQRPAAASRGGSLYVTQRSVRDWGVDLGACPRIESQAPFDTPRYRLQPGDLVVPRCGRGTLGRNRLTRFDGAAEPAVVDCFTDRLSLRGLSSAWVLGALRSPLGWDQIRRTFNGVGTPNLSFAEIRELAVPVPSVAVQQQAESLWADVAARQRPFSDLSDLVSSACGLELPPGH